MGVDQGFQWGRGTEDYHYSQEVFTFGTGLSNYNRRIQCPLSLRTPEDSQGGRSSQAHRDHLWGFHLSFGSTSGRFLWWIPGEFSALRDELNGVHPHSHCSSGWSSGHLCQLRCLKIYLITWAKFTGNCLSNIFVSTWRFSHRIHCRLTFLLFEIRSSYSSKYVNVGFLGIRFIAAIYQGLEGIYGHHLRVWSFTY